MACAVSFYYYRLNNPSFETQISCTLNKTTRGGKCGKPELYDLFAFSLQFSNISTII
jgi:hypothetical protein